MRARHVSRLHILSGEPITTSTTRSGRSAILPDTWATNASFRNWFVALVQPTSSPQPSSPNVFFQSNSASPVDLSTYKTLDIRLTRQCHDAACRNPGPQYHTSTNFSIQLITGTNGSKSGSAQVQDYISLAGPVGSLVS